MNTQQFDAFISADGRDLVSRKAALYGDNCAPGKWYTGEELGIFFRGAGKKKYRLCDSDKEEQRISLAIAKFNYEQDTNNKYYAKVYEDLKGEHTAV